MGAIKEAAFPISLSVVCRALIWLSAIALAMLALMPSLANIATRGRSGEPGVIDAKVDFNVVPVSMNATLTYLREHVLAIPRSY